MNNLVFSLNATIPVFLVMVVGYFLKRIKLINDEFCKVADKYVFKVALPVLLFKDIATADIRSDFDISFCLFCMIVTTIMFMGIWAGSYLLLKDKTMVGAFTQAAARGSAAILGVAFITNIYGSSGMGPMMIVSSVPLFNVYSVIILTFGAEYGKEKKANKSSYIMKVFINVLKNPIIIGIFLGLPFSILGIELPEIPLKTITSIAQTATPIALITIGAGFKGSSAIKKIKPTVAATLIKLVFLPMIFLPFAVAVGFRNSELIAILIMLGSPTTVTCYIMAKNMGNDEVLSSSVVVLATLLSSVTLTLWIWLLRNFALI